MTNSIGEPSRRTWTVRLLRERLAGLPAEAQVVVATNDSEDSIDDVVLVVSNDRPKIEIRFGGAT
jgi:hypothetical protein